MRSIGETARVVVAAVKGWSRRADTDYKEE
jgi:hypothetical protein